LRRRTDRTDDGAGEAVIAAGIGENADSRLLPHARERRRLQPPPARLLGILERDGERHEIVLADALAFYFVNAGEPPGQRILALGVIEQARGRDGCALDREPALRGDVLRHDTLFQ